MQDPEGTSTRVREILRRADKKARRQQQECLFPACDSGAVRCHSIPKSLVRESLAVDGHVYSLPIQMSAALFGRERSGARPIERVGITNAGVFSGYCNEHDQYLFSRAEAGDVARMGGMFISLHFRAVSLEYCRKRFVGDFFSAVVEMGRTVLPVDALERFSALRESYRLTAQFQRELYLQSLFDLIGGASNDRITYQVIAVRRNLLVAACGSVQVEDGFETGIAFNLLPFPDVTVLALTCFDAQDSHLDTYLSRYPISDPTTLFCDVAFRHCEEPILSPRLWEGLSPEQQFAVRLNLRPPGERVLDVDHRILRVEVGDLLTPSVEDLQALYRRVHLKDGDMRYLIEGQGRRFR